MMKNGKNPSEVGTPTVWVEIKAQNKEQLRADMRGTPPKVLSWKPALVMALFVWARLLVA